jgi:hypothetical protein
MEQAGYSAWGGCHHHVLAAEAEALQVKLTMENGNVVAPTSWA